MERGGYSPARVVMRSLGLLLLAALAGCAPAALLPTPTPAPSATAAPTATPLPSPTPAPDSSAIIRAALDRSAQADTYRLEGTLIGRGLLGRTQLGNTDREVLGLSGEFAGKNYHFTFRGFLTTFLGVDPQSGLEAMQVDGVRYVRGPLALINAPDAAWYRLGAAQALLASPLLTAATLEQLRDSRANFATFAPDGEDRVGNQRCAVYRGDRINTIALLSSLAASGLLLIEPGQITEAESWFVVCPDGYLHRVELAFSGVQPISADYTSPQPYSYRLTIALRDFDSAITIDPPADAVALPDAPIMPLPTRTP